MIHGASLASTNYGRASCIGLLDVALADAACMAVATIRAVGTLPIPIENEAADCFCLAPCFLLAVFGDCQTCAFGLIHPLVINLCVQLRPDLIACHLLKTHVVFMRHLPFVFCLCMQNLLHFTHHCRLFLPHRGNIGREAKIDQVCMWLFRGPGG